MKISIITTSFNSSRTIGETMDSVRRQKDAQIEHIVIDGKSTDRTLDVVEKYRTAQTILVSEKDKGIYDAMNKGARIASGDVIGFLNSDDFYADDNVLRDICESFANPSTVISYGDIEIFRDDSERKICRNWKAGIYRHSKLKFGWHPPHPTFYIRRNLFHELGGFDLNVGLAADYDFMVRALFAGKANVSYLPRVLVRMRQGGASTSGLAPVINGWKTCQTPWRKNNLTFWGYVAATLKPLRKLLQVRL